MKLIKTEKHVECIPLAFAMVLDVEVKEIYNFLGHDGTERIKPELKEPYCYRGFHPAEIIPFAWSLGYSVTQFCVKNYLQYLDGYLLLCIPPEKAEEHMYNALRTSNGVFLGTMHYTKAPHAVAWNYAEKTILDPAGIIYDIECNKIQIEAFYAIVKNK